MANWFDQVTKTMADKKLGRRQAMKTIAGTVAGAALAGYLPETALANKNSNTNCFCFANIKGKADCGCDYLCSSATHCTKNSDCGKGHYCSITCCGTMDCIQNCNSTCVLGSGHGKTGAGI